MTFLFPTFRRRGLPRLASWTLPLSLPICQRALGDTREEHLGSSDKPNSWHRPSRDGLQRHTGLASHPQNRHGGEGARDLETLANSKRPVPGRRSCPGCPPAVFARRPPPSSPGRDRTAAPEPGPRLAVGEGKWGAAPRNPGSSGPEQRAGRTSTGPRCQTQACLRRPRADPAPRRRPRPSAASSQARDVPGWRPSGDDRVRRAHFRVPLRSGPRAPGHRRHRTIGRPCGPAAGSSLPPPHRPVRPVRPCRASFPRRPGPQLGGRAGRAAETECPAPAPWLWPPRSPAPAPPPPPAGGCRFVVGFQVWLLEEYVIFFSVFPFVI